MRFKMKNEAFNSLSKEELMSVVMSSSVIAICDAVVHAITDITTTVLRDNMANMFEELLEDFDPDEFKDLYERSINIRIEKEMLRDMVIMVGMPKEEEEN